MLFSTSAIFVKTSSRVYKQALSSTKQQSFYLYDLDVIITIQQMLLDAPLYPLLL